MEKLTRSLARTLAAIRPYEGDEDFMRKILAKESPIDGYPVRRLAEEVGELQRLGYVDVEVYYGRPIAFDLTSKGRDYRRNRVLGVAKTAMSHVFQLLMGASGGLVVFILGRLLAQ